MSDTLKHEPGSRLAHLSAAQRQALLQQVLKQRTQAAEAGIPRREGGGPAPLSFAQRRLWMAGQMDPDSPTYNMVTTLRVSGPLQVGALRRAILELARRHEVLRSTLHAGADGEPVQVVRPPSSVAVPLVSLEWLPAGAREGEARRLALGEALRPFDLAAEPPLRVRIVRQGAEAHVLMLTIHHVASDGWSQRLLMGELSALYAAFGAGLPSPLPEPALQYADYAAWQRARVSGEVLERHTDWWRRRLEGAPPLLELPTDRPRVAGAGERAGKRPFTLAAPLAAELHALARREGATLYMVLLAAWTTLLSRYCGSDDVVVGIPMGGRDRVELEDVAGLITSLLPLRANLSGDPAFAELVRRVREATLEVAQHQDLPLEGLVEVGSSRVDLQACKLEYSIVSPK